MSVNYRICSRCIMDTTDREIEFDKDGVCNHCNRFEKSMNTYPHNLGEDEKIIALDEIVQEMMQYGKNRRYDCVVGVSGGVDSTYTAFKLKELGLRPLAVHLDNGWNSELSVSNIEKVLKKLEIDLFTYVIDWEEFKDLQLSFLKASVPDGEIPTDHAIMPTLYYIAAKENIRHIVIGSNTSTEGVMPKTWAFGHKDWKYIKSVQNKFGNVKLKKYPHLSLLNLIYFKYVKGQKVINLLNYVPYIKKDVMVVLEKHLGWKYYGEKHFESIYTRFYQGYVLPQKFNIDKRRPHLSSLILSGQITRDNALEEMQKVTYPDHIMEEDKEYVIKKLCITPEEFDMIMNLPSKDFWDYPSYHKHPLFKIAKAVYHHNIK